MCDDPFRKGKRNGTNNKPTCSARVINFQRKLVKLKRKGERKRKIDTLLHHRDTRRVGTERKGGRVSKGYFNYSIGRSIELYPREERIWGGFGGGEE